MTDLLLSHINHTAPLVDSLGSASASTSTTNNRALNVLPAEEEDYTIKCICEFQEDDGNTVFCEKCETWQHIECYYHQKKVPDVHNCADCEPRAGDARRATERQRRRREQIDTGDRKIKKPASKSHKKKVKAPEHHVIHTNGWTHEKTDLAFVRNGGGGSPRDQPPPAKRSKTSHRASNSMHAQATPANPTSYPSNRSLSGSHSLQSPSKTPSGHSSSGYHTEPYSQEFLQLYDHDPGDAPMQANLFNDIAIASSLSLWSDDVEALTNAANGRTPQDIFMRCDQSLDSMDLPQLNKVTKLDESQDYDGLHPKWIFLTIDVFAPQNSIVGELRGKVGHMQDYVQDSANRWEYLRHPVPFVFFHPKLPIYIDTRREGTSCRYLRRSCRPNLTMKTILENGSDYHFCFVANQDLLPGTELTIGWVLDEHIRKYFSQNNDMVKQEGVLDTAGNYVTDWVGKVLADFGGCACEDPNECSMAVYDRRNSSFSFDSAIHMSNGKPKKGWKTRNQISPQSTGQATNSRSGSEALKNPEEEEQDDTRSSSGSYKSKPRSRDMTPHHASIDAGNALGLELTDREKRKIAAMEKNFEQDKQQPAHKKKKRTSGGSTINTPAVTAPKQIGPSTAFTPPPVTPGIPGRQRYVDSSTAQRYSGSPIARSPLVMGSTLAPTVGPIKAGFHPTGAPVAILSIRTNYVDSSMQTDLETIGDWYESADERTLERKPFMSLSKRLLMRCHQERIWVKENASKRIETSLELEGSAMAIPFQASMIGSLPDSTEERRDALVLEIDMHEVQAIPEGSASNTLVKSTGQKLRPLYDKTKVTNSSTGHRSTPVKPPPPPWPNEASQTSEQMQPLNGHRVSGLRVQLPLKQILSGNMPTTPTITGTPTSVVSNLAQSPFGQTPSSYPPPFATSSSSSFMQPSPVKKKLSLGDYMSRRGNSKIETSTIAALPAKLQEDSNSPMEHSLLKSLASMPGNPKSDVTEGVIPTEASKAEAINSVSDRQKSKSSDNDG